MAPGLTACQIVAAPFFEEGNRAESGPQSTFSVGRPAEGFWGNLQRPLSLRRPADDLGGENLPGFIPEKVLLRPAGRHQQQRLV